MTDYAYATSPAARWRGIGDLASSAGTSMSGNLPEPLRRILGIRFVPYGRAMTVVASVLAFFTVLAEPSMRPGAGSTGTTVMALIVLVGCVAAAILAIRGSRLAHAAALALVAVLVIASIAFPYTPAPDGHVGTGTLVLMATAVVATVLPLGWALLANAGCALLMAWVLSPASASALASDTIGRILYSAEAVALGVSLAGIGVGLAVAQRRVVAAREDAHAREVALHSAQEASRALADRESRIHDTVLNTLTTIARTEPGTADGALRIRAGQAADELAEITAGGHGSAGDLQAACGDVITRLRGDGVDVVWRGASNVPVDERAAAALVSAVREALLNAWEHASAAHVEVVVNDDADADADAADHDRADAAASGSWTIRIQDDGVGFGGASHRQGFGQATVLGTRMAEAGLVCDVASASGSGTTVVIRGARVRPAAESAERWSASWIAGPIAYPVLVSNVPMMLAALLLTLPTVQRPLLDVLAAVLLAAGSAVILVAVVRGRVGWPASLLVVGLGIAAYLVQLAAGPQSGTPWGLFAVGTLAVLLATLCMTGPPRVVIACLLVWVGLALIPSGEGLLPSVWVFNALIVIGGAAVGRFLRRSIAEADEIERQSQAAARAVAAADEVGARLRAREALIAEAQTSALLRRFSDGELEALPAVEAARHEQYLRSVMGLDPAAVPLHRWAGELARQGWHRGLDVSIRLAARPVEPALTEPTSPEVGELVPVICEDDLASRISPGAPVFVTQAGSDATVAVRVVTFMGAESIDELSRLGLVEVADEETGECVLLLTT